MKLIAQVKLQPSKEQYQALLKTLEAVNDAANYIGQKAWETQTFRQYDLHHLLYYDLRERFNLTAQIVVRVLAKVADAYKLDRKAPRTFNRHGSIAYDKRILSWKPTEVSIWTVDGRLKIPFVSGNKQSELLQYRQGEADLIYRDGDFYLHQVCEVEEPPAGDVKDFLGIDLGIVNIAADSDGTLYSGGQVNGLRKRHARLRGKLQSKGTKAATRLLVKRKRKEQRFGRHINHVISKSVVAKAKDSGRGIALEDLKGIRDRITVRKGQRRQHHSWAFNQLRRFIEYKARLAGVLVSLVDPRHTSQMCPACGTVDKRNRPSQALFSCVSCGYSAPADTVAATIISRRAVVNRPYFSPVPSGAG
ncbi:MAG: transposase [Dehalococcoidia bacterium]|nr:transposase [Dehalococcoidia bacterium]